MSWSAGTRYPPRRPGSTEGDLGSLSWLPSGMAAPAPRQHGWVIGDGLEDPWW